MKELKCARVRSRCGGGKFHDRRTPPLFFRIRLAAWLLGASLVLQAGHLGRAAESELASPSPRTELTTQEICARPFFDHQLRPSGDPTPAQNRDLLAALENFGGRAERDDFSSLTEYLARSPNSAWAHALESQLGNEYYRVGRYSRAIAAWERVWNAGKSARDEASAAVAYRAGSELAMIYARLGRMSELRPLLSELQKGTTRGAKPRNIRGALDGLWSMEHRPEVSFRCGPLALDRICFATDRGKAGNPLIQNSQSTTNGFSARQVAELSRRLGMNYQVAYRHPGAEIILPAVVHWKVGHYAALIARDGKLLRAEDPTFGNTKVWLSDDALDEEASGYFLVRSGPLPNGWREVSTTEADQVWGKGTTNQSDEDETLDQSTQTCKDPNPNHDYKNNYSHDPNSDSIRQQSVPMAVWSVHLLLASHHVEDTPVGYTPPVGPPVYIRLSYNSINGWPDFGLPYSNVSQEWRLNWLAYLTDDPLNPAGDVKFAANGGGTMTFTDYNSTNKVFRNLFRNRATLVRTGTNSYEMRYPDGSKKIFDHAVTSVGTARKIFMSAVVDAAGNAVTVQFDQPGRITSITDAIGQKTRFFYDRPLTNEFIHPSVAWVPPFILTRVMDPFGRTATFDYGSTINARLASITDVIGITSSFRYHYIPGQPDLGMTNLITPYGVTAFKKGSHRGVNRANWVEITHPSGEKERVEYSEELNLPSSEPLGIVPKGVPVRNYILWARNTCHWDRKAYAEGYSRLDYTKARIYHWLHGQDYTTASGILESYKNPLEHRIWFNYEGQVNATFVGTSDQPTKISRTLEDGTTQLYQYEYNSRSKPTKVIDPVGRTFSFVYDTNDIDVTEVRQTGAGQNELLLSATYDSRHLPLTLTDAAGKTTRFGYNARGQMLAITNALGHASAFAYDTNGYLIAVDGPLPGTNDTSRFTYDAVGRVRTLADTDGYLVTIDYDAIDRPTTITYPDGTYEEITYDRLDPVRIRDRAGRETRLFYDSLRQLTGIQDTLGRLTRYEWCGCGALSSLIDPMDRITTWERDVQGRVKSKVYPDGRKIRYEYDTATGWLTQIRDQQNQVTKFDYNLDGTLRQKSYLNARIPTPPVKFTYDPNYRRIATMEDGIGVTTLAYHPIGNPGAARLASMDGPLPNDTFTFAYDELGRLSDQGGNGVGVHRGWDAAGRVTLITNILGAFHYNWDGTSRRLSSASYPNGQTTEYAYYPNFRDRLLQRITHRLPGGALLSEFSHEYDVLGRMTNWSQTQGGALKSWLSGYDAGDRLLSVAESSSTGPARSFNFGYDWSDNRTFEQVDGLRRDFFLNAGNELVAVSNSPVGTMTYVWDAEHRLVAITNGNRTSEFSYDGLNRRSRAVERENGLPVSETRYVWIGTGLAEERDASGGSVLKRYFPQGMRSDSGASVPPGSYFYSRDHLTSVREMTDSSGAVRAQYDYAPYGLQQRVAGDTHSDLGFTGHPFHQLSGLNLAVYRAYDARLGRWVSRDSLGEGWGPNLYAYVHNDPVNRMDPLGLAEESGEVPAAPDSFSWENVKQLFDDAVHKFGPKSIKVGPINISGERPEISVGTGVDLTVEGQKVVTVSGECGVGVTTEGTASDELFYLRWKLKFKTILSKIPVIGKRFEGETSGEVKFGKTEFNPDSLRERQQIEQGINPRTGESLEFAPSQD